MKKSNFIAVVCGLFLLCGNVVGMDKPVTNGSCYHNKKAEGKYITLDFSGEQDINFKILEKRLENEKNTINELNLKGCKKFCFFASIDFVYDILENHHLYSQELPNIKYVTIINLSHTNVRTPDVNSFFVQCPQLQELDISYCKGINLKKVKWELATNLRTLNLSHTNCTNDFINKIFDILEKNTNGERIRIICDDDDE